MSEYIKRQDAYDAVLFAMCGTGYQYDATRAIDGVPAADVAPVVHGEWLNTDGDYTSAACSICKTEYEVATEEEAEKGLWDAFMCSYRYCPNCGAKMDRRNET